MTNKQKEKFKHIVGQEWDDNSNEGFFGTWARGIGTHFCCTYRYVINSEKIHIMLTHRMTSDNTYIIDTDGKCIAHYDSDLDIYDIQPRELYITSDGKRFDSVGDAYKHQSKIYIKDK